ncbi:Integrase core domain containing protein [Aphelenchoides avenae]|nr:Integrase core domain containing protein [Aphelenchus avenae]
MTIPQSELMGSLIGARAAKFVMKELRQMFEWYLWSDSATVVRWLNNPDRVRGRFVDNRVREIVGSGPKEIRFVPTADNAADIGTRSLPAYELKHSPWVLGPAWLREDPAKWPAQIELAEPKEDPERWIEAAARAGPITEKRKCLLDWKRFSTIARYRRYVGAMLLFIGGALRGKRTCPESYLMGELWERALKRPKLQLADIADLVELVLIREAQADFSVSYSEAKKLGLKLDQGDVWICEGRFHKAHLPNRTVNPAYLPRESKVTELMILDAHAKVGHQGHACTLANLRLAYWVPKGQSAVKRVLHHECYACRRDRAKPFAQPRMAQLPEERVTRYRPFGRVQTDFLGPIQVRRLDGSVQKAWVAIWACMTTRNIHLEWLSSLSTESFMNAFKRFIGRRGRPDVCYSDNAATYKLAGRTIEWAWKELAWDDGFSCYLAKECIQWRFTTELAPWENGAVECMVKPVKKAYYKLVGRRILTGEELSSLLPQIEAIVNSRPLVAISDDPEAGVLPHSFSKTQ